MIHIGDALTVLRTMPDESVHCVVTSPPYWRLRDYGTGVWENADPDCDHKQNHGTQGSTGDRADRAFTGAGIYREKCLKCGGRRVDQQIGLEPTFPEYIFKMVTVFRELRRVLRSDGTCWVNIGDSYCSDGAVHKPTTLAGARVPSGWTNRAQPQQAHVLRKKKDVDPKRGVEWSQNALYKSISPKAALKPKDLCMIPHRLAIALQDDGWWVRSDIVWAKPNPMPESVYDRPTKAHEYIFLLAKSERYYYDAAAIAEACTGTAHARARKNRPDKWPNAWSAEDGRHDGISNGRFTAKGKKTADPDSGIKNNSSFSAAVSQTVDTRNKRSVWEIPTEPFPEAHFATFPEALVQPCILAGCPPGGTVLDPFAGSGTTGAVAERFGRQFILIELNPSYVAMAVRRTENAMPLLKGIVA